MPDPGARPARRSTTRLAAAAVGLAAGLTLDEIAAGLAGGWSAPHRVDGRPSRGRDGHRRHLQRLARLGAWPRSTCWPGCPGRRVRGPRRDARARRRATTTATAASARPPAGRPTCSSSSAPGAAGDRRGRGRGRPRRRRGSSTSPTRPRPSTSCGRGCATATSSWSRRRAGSASSALVDGAAAPSTGRRRRDDRRADPGAAARVRARRHPHAAVHPAPAGRRLRQADPRGGPREPLPQGGDAHDGRPPHRGRRARDLLLPPPAGRRRPSRRSPRSRSVGFLGALRRLPQRPDAGRGSAPARSSSG